MNLLEKTAFLQNLLKQKQNLATRTGTYQAQYHKLYLNRRMSEFLFILILQFINTKLDTLNNTVHLISFSAAVNLILVFWRGFHIAPLMLLSHFVLYLIPLTHTSLATGIHDALEPCIIVYLCRQICGPVIPFTHLRDWYGYFIICGLIVISCSAITANFSLQNQFTRLNAYCLIVPSNLIYASYPFLKHLLSKHQKYQLFVAITVIVIGAVFAPALTHGVLFYLLLTEAIVLLLALHMQLYGLAFGNLGIALGLMSNAWPMQYPLLISTILIIGCCAGFQIAIPCAKRKFFNI